MYNGTLAMRLVILEGDTASFRGKMEYPQDDTATIVEGTIHQCWPPEDKLWVQIDNRNSEPTKSAVSFKETGYERRGRRTVSFEGEYRAFLTMNEIVGAWFAGSRLVGTLKLRQVASPR
jgi:hypothetical protein